MLVCEVSSFSSDNLAHSSKPRQWTWFSIVKSTVHYSYTVQLSSKPKHGSVISMVYCNLQYTAQNSCKPRHGLVISIVYSTLQKTVHSTACTLCCCN